MTFAFQFPVSWPGRFLAVVGDAILAGHCLVHLMGVALLWKLGEPGDLRYGGAVPTAGTVPGYLFGALWFAGRGAVRVSWGAGRWSQFPVWRCHASDRAPPSADVRRVVNAVVLGVALVWWRGRKATP